MTAAEQKELHARAMTAVDQALRNHGGVSLTGSELTHVGAAIAEFVSAELSRVGSAKAEPAEEEDEPKKKAKRRTSDD